MNRNDLMSTLLEAWREVTVPEELTAKYKDITMYLETGTSESQHLVSDINKYAIRARHIKTPKNVYSASYPLEKETVLEFEEMIDSGNRLGARSKALEMFNTSVIDYTARALTYFNEETQQ